MIDSRPAVHLESEEVGVFNRRFGVRLRDESRVEAVLYRGDTLCISSQVGCAVRCPFCASGAKGLGRSLSLEELQGQVEAVGRVHELQRITISGVGEPLHNPATVDFLTWARDRRLKVSLTTSGGPLSRLRAWLHRPHNGLTISVHSGQEETRRRLVPKGPSLADLEALLAEEVPRLTRRRKKKTALAYLLLRGENDAATELDAFAHRALPLGLSVHLYAFNPVATSEMERATREAYEAAYARLVAAGLRVRMSSKARVEANGGCGTLVALRT
ncbi:MAG: radical SAM protein [Myxococcota bacterium]